jgi:hypothetical protein
VGCQLQIEGEDLAAFGCAIQEKHVEKLDSEDKLGIPTCTNFLIKAPKTPRDHFDK